MWARRARVVGPAGRGGLLDKVGGIVAGVHAVGHARHRLIGGAGGTAARRAATASAFYTLPALFVGPLGQSLRGSPLVRAMQVFPTYNLARGLLDALEGRATPGEALLDLAVVAGCTALVFGAALWSLRREAAAMGAI